MQGPWGVGKSAFLAAAAEQSAAAGRDVVRLSGAEDRRHLGFGALAGLLPEPDAADPERAVALLSRTHRGPTVVLVDDAQWLDPASALVVRLWHRAAEPDHLFLLASLPDPAPRPALVELAATHRTWHRELIPFDRDELRGLVVERYFEEVSDRFAAELHRVTGGIPYFAQELCGFLDVEGVDPDDVADELETLVPSSLRRATSARLERLDPVARGVLRDLAVLGDLASPRRLARLGGIDPLRIEGAAHALVRAGLVEHTWPFHIPWPTLRSAVLRCSPSIDVMGRRLEAARLLHDEGEAPRYVAQQLLDTAPNEGEHWIVEACDTAARRAIDRGDLRLAARCLTRALEDAIEPAEHGRILAELGRTEASMGEGTSAETHLLDAVDLLEDPGLRGRCYYDLGRLLVAQGRLEEALEVLEAGWVQRGLSATTRTGIATELWGTTWLDPGLRPDEPQIEFLDPELGGAVAGFRDLLRAEPGPDQRRALVRAATSSIGLAEGDSLATQATVAGLVWLDAYDDAERILDRVERRGGDAHPGVLTGVRAHHRAIIALHRGQLDQALDLARTGFRHLMLSWPRLASLPLADGVRAAIELDDLDAGDEFAAGAPAETPWRALPTDITWLDARGWLELAHGEPDRALDTFRRSGAVAEQFGVLNPALTDWRGGMVLAHLALGEPERGRDLAEEQVKLAEAGGSARAVAAALGDLAAVRDVEAAVPRLREAAELMADHPARLEHARSLLALGRALRRQGQRREAADAILAATEAALELGAWRTLRLATGEARGLGVPEGPGVEERGPGALTPTERRVAVRAVQGLTNREIANQLYVTVKTVEYHLSNVYMKLGISGRRELPIDIIEPDPASA